MTKITKSVKKIPKSIISKWIKVICFSLVLSSSAPNSVKAQNFISPLAIEKVDENSLENIITKYHLESQRELIFENQDKFLKFYQAVMHNPTYTEVDKEVALQDFWIIIKYFPDFEEVLKDVQNREIIIDDELCLQEGADGIHYDNTNIIVLKNDVSKETRNHENIHDLFDNKKEYYAYKGLIQEETKNPLYFDHVIKGRALGEALASDLSAMNYSSVGITTMYPNLNTCLQGLYLIYGRDNIIKMLAEYNGIEQLYKTILSTGIDHNNLYNFFDHLEIQRQVYTNEIKLDQNSLDLLYCQLAEDLINIYETKTKSSWLTSPKMQSIIYSLIQRVPLYENNYIIGIARLKEFQSLRENPSFLTEFNINDSDMIANLQVIVDSTNKNWPGVFCIHYQTEFINMLEPNCFQIALTESGTIRKNSYNKDYNNFITELSKYGITENQAEPYLKNIAFYTSYKVFIEQNELLDSNDKIYLIQKFPDFINLHPELFINEINSSNAQILFKEALKNSKTKKDIYNLYCDEELLYKMISSDTKNRLTRLNICDEKDQIFYLKHGGLFDYYIFYLKCSKLKISPENIQELIWLFPTFVENHMDIYLLSENEIILYLEEIFNNMKSLEELKKFITTPNKSSAINPANTLKKIAY